MATDQPMFAKSLFVHEGVDVHRPGYFLMMPHGDTAADGVLDRVTITDGPFDTEADAWEEAELVDGDRYVMWLGGLDSGVSLQ